MKLIIIFYVLFISLLDIFVASPELASCSDGLWVNTQRVRNLFRVNTWINTHDINTFPKLGIYLFFYRTGCRHTAEVGV